jgi:hypothetical protein
VDSVLEHATERFWINFDRPLKDEGDARFLFDLYMLVHVRPQNDPDAQIDTHICAMKRILKPSLLEFLEGVTYKTHLRKIAPKVATTLQGEDTSGKSVVKRVKQEMMKSHGTMT